MFGTLRYDRESRHAEFIDRTDSFLGDAANEHSACDKCRLTKLRCSGQRAGCDRCKSRGTTCVYSATGGRESRWRKRGNSHESREQDQQREQEQQRQRQRQSIAAPTEIQWNSPTSASTEPTSSDQDSINAEADSEQQQHQTQQQQQQKQALDQTAASEPPLSNIDPCLDLPPSPYDTLDLTMADEFLTSSFLDACDIVIPDIDADDGFSFLTSAFLHSASTPSSNPLSGVSGVQPSPINHHSPSRLLLQTTTPGELEMGSSSMPKSASSCNCLPTIVMMLEELDALVLAPVPAAPQSLTGVNVNVMANAALDDMLASLKTAIAHAAQILPCTRCHARGEHMALLTRVCEMLVRLCDRIVLSYLHQPPATSASGANSLPTPANSIHRSSLSSGTSPNTPTTESSMTMSSPTSGSNNNTQTVFFGRYKTDPSEWECLMRVLISMQLKGLSSLLAGVRRSASSAQLSRLQSAEALVRTLASQLQGSTRGLGKFGNTP